MTGQLIPTGVTFGVGRNSLNDAFSGTANLNNIQLDSGGNFSAGTGGGIIFSAGTNLYDIFATTGGGENLSQTLANGNSTSGNDIVLTDGDAFSANTYAIKYNAFSVGEMSFVRQSGGSHLFAADTTDFAGFLSGLFQIGYTSNPQIALTNTSNGYGINLYASTLDGTYNQTLQSKDGVIANIDDIAVLSANNGLGISGTNITFGGLLTGDTTIDVNGNEMLYELGSAGTFIVSGSSGGNKQIVIGNGQGTGSAYFSATKSSAALNGNSFSSLVTTTIKTNGGTSPSWAITYDNGSGSSRQISSTATQFNITDEIDGAGIRYTSNYHGGYVSRSLVDKEYVDNVALSAITFQNGLTFTTNQVELGGSLISATTISPNSHEMLIDAGSNTSSIFQVSGSSGVASQIRLASYNNSTFPVFLDIGKGIAALYGLSAGTNQARFEVTSASAKIEYTESAQTKRFIVDTDDFTFEDNIDNRGVVYQAKYHSNYTNRSLVDKEYVDNTVNTGVTYIDSYLHFNAQTTLPSPESGRLFFSGTPLFRLMLNTGGTAADWIIL